LASFGVVTLTLFFLSACASSGPSTSTVDQSITRATTAVAQADAAGAREYAPLAFSNAEDKVRDSKKATASGDHPKALQLAEEAEVDAQFAEAKAVTAKAEKAAAEVQQSIKTLREEIVRKQVK
jgi:ABC-type Fe3+-hydroxamate transport system substrate-binding protein